VKGDDLTCRALVARVTDYLEGALSPLERRAMENHATRCRGCAIHLNQMRRTVAAIGSSRARASTADDASAPAKVHHLLAAFRASAAERKT
jgi:anti-sigma factor RsiW